MNREFIEYLSARKNETLAVATILFTRGSTPRKAGTSMVVFPDGSISVSYTHLTLPTILAV